MGESPGLVRILTGSCRADLKRFCLFNTWERFAGYGFVPSEAGRRLTPGEDWHHMHSHFTEGPSPEVSVS
jgi:hypothetical protein